MEIGVTRAGTIPCRTVARKASEAAVLIAALTYASVFIAKQCIDFGDPWFIEYDARGTTLPAWRYHGTGLFLNDLPVDYMNKMYFTMGCRVLFWIGTLFTNPIHVARVLPFLALAVVLWQGAAFAYKRTGIWGVALTIFLIIHSSCIWARLLGFNARAFGYPLTFCFIRYVSDRNERKSLLTLLAAAVCYPSVLLLLGPAYVIVLAARRAKKPQQVRALVAAAILVAVLAIPILRPDPRIGSPPTYSQASTLRQMQRGGFQPFYPLPAAWPSIRFTWDLAFAPSGNPLTPGVQNWARKNAHELEIGLIVILVCLSARQVRAVTVVLPALVVAGFVMFGVISLVAYRLYLPDRPLTFAFPAVLVLGLPALTTAAFRRFSYGGAPAAATVVLTLFFLLSGGDGLARVGYSYKGYHTPLYDFVARLPKTILIAGHPTTSQMIQTFAQRRTLFSDMTNTPFYYEYALEMERRMEGYFRAYYSSDLQMIRDFSRRWNVDYLYVKSSDFGPQALSQAVYCEPWATLSRTLILSQNGRPMALENIPPGAIAYRHGMDLLIDLHRL